MSANQKNQLTYKDLSIDPLYGPGVNSPISFYQNVLPLTIEVELGLGYFSSTAFEALSKAFQWNSKIIPNFKVISNDRLSSEDIYAFTSEIREKNLI